MNGSARTCLSTRITENGPSGLPGAGFSWFFSIPLPDFLQGFPCFGKDFGVCRQVLPGIHDKQIEAFSPPQDLQAQRFFLEPVCFAQDSFDPVSVNGFPELPGTNAHGGLQQGLRAIRMDAVNDHQRVNGHAFPGLEDGLDALPAFKPFCFVICMGGWHFEKPYNRCMPGIPDLSSTWLAATDRQKTGNLLRVLQRWVIPNGFTQALERDKGGVQKIAPDIGPELYKFLSRNPGTIFA
jgi:hypothetical protein